MYKRWVVKTCELNKEDGHHAVVGGERQPASSQSQSHAEGKLTSAEGGSKPQARRHKGAQERRRRRGARGSPVQSDILIILSILPPPAISVHRG